eukprot:6205328-Pleurochrysis_carterae.AAC.2
MVSQKGLFLKKPYLKRRNCHMSPDKELDDMMSVRTELIRQFRPQHLSCVVSRRDIMAVSCFVISTVEAAYIPFA